MLRQGESLTISLVVFDDEKMKWTCLRRVSRLKDDAMFQKFIFLQLYLRKKGKKTGNY